MKTVGWEIFVVVVVVVVVSIGMLTCSAPASAAFVHNYSVWSSMTPAEKAAYAMGTFGLHTTPIKDVDW